MAHISPFALSKLWRLQEDLSQVNPPGSSLLVGFPWLLLTTAEVGGVRKFGGDKGALDCALLGSVVCSVGKTGVADPPPTSAGTPTPAEFCRRDAMGQIPKDTCRFGW